MNIKNMYNKMIDMTNIFGLFVPGEELDGTKTATNLDELKTKPIFHVGMYKKLVLNNSNFNKKIVKFFKDSNEDLDVDEMSEAGEFITYQRAWKYIKDINPEDEYHIKIIKKCSNDEFLTSLKLGISYFEEKEMYENCFLLKQILDLTEVNEE